MTHWTRRSMEYDACIDRLETDTLCVEIRFNYNNPARQQHLIDIFLKPAKPDEKMKVKKTAHRTSSHDDARTFALQAFDEYLDALRQETKQALINTLTKRESDHATEP